MDQGQSSSPSHGNRCDVPTADLERVPVQGALLLAIDVAPPALAATPLLTALRARRADVLVAGADTAGRHLARGCAVLVAAGPWSEPDGWRALADAQRRAGCAVAPIHLGSDAACQQARIGHPIAADRLARSGDDLAARTDYLRLRAELQSRRTGDRRPALARAAAPAPIALRAPAEVLAAEIAALPADDLLVTGNGMQVFCSTAAAIPQVLLEIGRLRELTFRAVGEGSGTPRDLDRHDSYYRHLFVWDGAAREVVGAYRLGCTDELLRRGGPGALYTNAFYEFRPQFWDRVSPALELGRSFVQPAYQRGFAPLLLLWRGIGAFVARHPRYHRLFGTVSISADHHATSVALMLDHLATHCLADELAPFVRSRQPWRGDAAAPARSWQPQQIADLHEVSSLVRELETGRNGVPVLMEQYLKLGARLLGSNQDPDFHTVDALVLVDLLRAPAHLQKRYLGAEGAERLRRCHAEPPSSVA